MVFGDKLKQDSRPEQNSFDQQNSQLRSFC